MKRSIPFILIAALTVTGCAGSNNTSRQTEDFRAEIQNSPELLDIDASLDTLEEKTSEMSAKYEELQTNVLPRTSFDSDDADDADKLIIFVNENNVLNVNGKTMSRNDFTAFADKTLPKLCAPVPQISIHKKADYDTAVWVLDALYSHGCQDVNIE